MMLTNAASRSLARILCLLTMSVVVADNSLSVTQPQELRKQFGGGSGLIAEQPSLFGMPAYGRSMRGRVYWPNDTEEQLGCKPLKTPNTDTSKEPLVFLFKRGGCTFVTKVRRAQDAGATAVIVINNDNNELPHMSNDGSGASIVIPSLIIKKADGEKLSQFASEHGNSPIEVSIEYGLPESDSVDYTLWTSSMDPQALEFKMNFRKVAKALEKKTNFNVHYFFVRGESYGCDKGDICGNQCTNQGKYCAVDPDHDLSSGVSGAEVVQENLRQLCIFQAAKRAEKEYLWWAYVNDFRTSCGSANTVTEACSAAVIKKIDGLSYDEVHQCVESSGGADPQSSSTNSIIDAELKKKEDDGIYLLPTVLINSITYYGSLSCPLPLDMAHCGVLKTICTAFTDGLEPAVCSPSKGCELGKTRDVCDRCIEPDSDDFITNPEECSSREGGASVGTVIILIIVFIGILVGAAFVYHQHTANKMRDELRSIMSQYVPLEGDNVSTEQSRFI